MKIVTPPLTVENEDSFSNDLFGRENFGQALLRLITRSDDELVISLDSKWGEGKTTFVKMWQGLLSKENVPNIYIDAFSIDYLDDPFVSVVSAILSYAEKNIDKKKKPEFEEFKEKSKRVGRRLLSWSGKLGAKAITLGLLKNDDLDELKDIAGDVAQDTSKLIGNYIDDRISSYEDDIENTRSFRTMLSDLPTHFTNKADKPLVIIIDELDRCKPTFSVELLEKVKHLFSVRNVVFVLVMHKAQLEESIKFIYGPKIDAHSYLQKFVSLDASLPKNIGKRGDSDLAKYAEKLFQIHDLETWGDKPNLLSCTQALIDHFNLSFRQLEKVFTNYAIYYGSSHQNSYRPVGYIAFLSVIKVIQPKLFLELYGMKIDYAFFLKRLGLSEVQVEGLPRGLQRLFAWMQFGLMSDKEYEALPTDDPLTRFESGIWEYELERKEIIPFIGETLSFLDVPA